MTPVRSELVIIGRILIQVEHIDRLLSIDANVQESTRMYSVELDVCTFGDDLGGDNDEDAADSILFGFTCRNYVVKVPRRPVAIKSAFGFLHHTDIRAKSSLLHKFPTL